ELEGGPRVVVETAHESRVQRVPDAEGGERLLHPGEVLAALVTQVVRRQGRIREKHPDLRALVIEYPQGVDPGTLSGGLVEGQTLEELLQDRPVNGAAFLAADRGQVEPVAAQSEPAVPLVRDGDHFGVEQRIVHPDRLHTDLLQLAVTALLRPPS